MPGSEIINMPMNTKKLALDLFHQYLYRNFKVSKF